MGYEHNKRSGRWGLLAALLRVADPWDSLRQAERSQRGLAERHPVHEDRKHRMDHVQPTSWETLVLMHGLNRHINRW